MNEEKQNGHEGQGPMRRVLWRGKPVYVVEDEVLGAKLEELARQNPSQVRTLSAEEAGEIRESFDITRLLTLREIRRERDLSQLKLAKMSGVTNRSIMKIEQHQSVPSYKSIERLSQALGVHPDSVAEFAVARRWEDARIRPLSALLPDQEAR